MIQRHTNQALSIVLILMLAFSACTSTADQPAAASGKFSITVQGLDGEVLATSEIDSSGDTSAFEALDTICKQAGIDLFYSDSGENAYVTAIGSLEAGDEGDMSGWMFKVNGAMAEVGMGQYKPVGGDEILVYYTRDFMAEYGE